MIKFRDLTADEIDCRVGQVWKDGTLVLLLYKDARCDMNILDETVGCENWQRKHYECKGNLFCSVGINVNYKTEKEPLWVWKDDCGTESYTEKEKGESSDSFKRSCFCWSIGRELYTAPKITIPKGSYTVSKDGKCYDSFIVNDIKIENKKIVKLRIKNEQTRQIVFEYGYTSEDKKKAEIYATTILKLIDETKTDSAKFWAYFLNSNQLLEANKLLSRKKEKQNG